MRLAFLQLYQDSLNPFLPNFAGCLPTENRSLNKYAQWCSQLAVCIQLLSQHYAQLFCVLYCDLSSQLCYQLSCSLRAPGGKPEEAALRQTPPTQISSLALRPDTHRMLHAALPAVQQDVPGRSSCLACGAASCVASRVSASARSRRTGDQPNLIFDLWIVASVA